MEDAHRLEPLPAVTLPESPQHLTLTRKEFLATFQFAQGYAYTQEHIFRYLKALHPDLALSQRDYDDLLERSMEVAHALANDQSRHSNSRKFSSDDVRANLQQALDMAKRALNSPVPQDRREIVDELASRILSTEVVYLTRTEGRGHRPDMIGHFNPHKDSWRSDLCYFGFLRNPTGLADLDKMYRELATYWRAYVRDKRYNNPKNQVLQELQQVVGIFNQHHPDMPVRLSFHHPKGGF